MSPMRELPPELLQRFTHVDYADHLALVAEVFAGGRETVIAEARYVRRADRRGRVRRLRSRGVAGQGPREPAAGQARLPRSRGRRAQRMVGETLASNGRMLPLARKAGLHDPPSPDVGGLMLLEKPLSLASCAPSRKPRRLRCGVGSTALRRGRPQATSVVSARSIDPAAAARTILAIQRAQARS